MGVRQARNAAAFALEIFFKIHAGIELRHLVAVAVEQERLALGELADAALGRLAPPRMVDVGVDVGEKAVLGRPRLHPRRRGRLLDEADFYDRLDALEAILPRHDQADGRAVLVRQRLAVEADRE